LDHKDAKGVIRFIRDMHKVRKRQGKYLEFGHTQGEIKKKPAKKYINIQQGVKLWKLMVSSVSPYLSFFLSASIATT
jgi:hypothetical protein